MDHTAVCSPSTRSLGLGLASGWLFAGAVGCDAETGFSKADTPPVTQEGSGEIDVQPPEIRIEDIDWEGGIAKGQLVAITNLGDNNLRVHDVSLISNAGGALYLEEVDDLNLAPGATAEFSVVATLTTFEPVESALRIQSGDVDESNLSIPILALPEGYVPTDDTGASDSGTDG